LEQQYCSSSIKALDKCQCELWTNHPISTDFFRQLKTNAPIRRSDWKLLVDKLASLLENEVTSLGFATFACAKRSDQNPLGVGDEGIRKFFLFARNGEAVSIWGFAH